MHYDQKFGTSYRLLNPTDFLLQIKPDSYIKPDFGLGHILNMLPIVTLFLFFCLVPQLI